MKYTLCHPCATAITNDDYSGLEYHSEDLADKVRAFAASAGYLVLGDVIDKDPTTCDACGKDVDTALGDFHAYAAQPLNG